MLLKFKGAVKLNILKLAYPNVNFNHLVILNNKLGFPTIFFRIAKLLATNRLKSRDACCLIEAQIPIQNIRTLLPTYQIESLLCTLPAILFFKSI